MSSAADRFWTKDSQLFPISLAKALYPTKIKKVDDFKKSF